MNNTLSELSKPVAWLAIYHGEVYDDAISITRSVVEAQADRFGWESALTEITRSTRKSTSPPWIRRLNFGLESLPDGRSAPRTQRSVSPSWKPR